MKFTVICTFSNGRSVVTHVSDLSMLRIELDSLCKDLVSSNDHLVSFYVLNRSSVSSVGVLDAVV